MTSSNPEKPTREACRCCLSTVCANGANGGVTRREFLAGVSAVAGGAMAISAAQATRRDTPAPYAYRQTVEGATCARLPDLST